MFKESQSFEMGNGPETAKQINWEGSTSSILTLPIIDQSVPISNKLNDEEAFIMFARRLALAGLIEPEKMVHGCKLIDVVQKVLKDNITAATGEMKTLLLNAQFIAPNAMPSMYSGFDEEFGNRKIDSTIGLQLEHAVQLPFINLENAIPQLNKVHPDLGQTLYAVLDIAPSKGIGFYTFSEMIHRFSYELQLDADSAEWYQETFDEEDEKDKKTSSTDIHQVDDLSKKFPFSWIPNPQLVLTPYEVFKIGETASPEIQNAIHAALEIMDLYDAGAKYFQSYVGEHPLMCLGQVSFFEHDPTEILIDELSEYANGSEFCHQYLYQGFIDLSTQKKFITEWNNMISGFELLGAIDRLVTALNKINEVAET